MTPLLAIASGLPAAAPAAEQGLVIDWTQMPTYNTIMSVAAGAALLTLLLFARDLRSEDDVHLDGWALALGVPGVILAATGLHMTLVWPFAKYFPFDNIIFGEPSLAFGVLLVAGAWYLWSRGATIAGAGNVARDLAAVARPLSVFVVGLGLSLIAIAAAGIAFQLFAAPPEEPISGAFASTPWVEATFMSGLFAFVGIGALVAPFALRDVGAERTAPRDGWRATMTGREWIVAVTWGLSGLGFLLFGALNFFTHIGLIVHTMG